MDIIPAVEGGPCRLDGVADLLSQGRIQVNGLVGLDLLGLGLLLVLLLGL